MGVRIDGVDKITYNHCDSYPESLGEDMVRAVREMLEDHGLEWLRTRARALRLVKADDPVTPQDIERLRGFADIGVASQRLTDWYCLLRGTQGELDATLDAGIMIDNHDFMRDSVFCEYAYIVNLDTCEFEVYRGFQGKPHDKGRYADLEPCDAELRKARGIDLYYPVALVSAFPLELIPGNWAQIAFPPDEEDE